MENPSRDPQGDIFIQEVDNALIVYESVGGVLNPLMRLVQGAITKAQIKYYQTALKGKIKGAEADLILEYFFEPNISREHRPVDEVVRALKKGHSRRKALEQVRQRIIADGAALNKGELVKFILNDTLDPDNQSLTPEYISTIIAPYLSSIIELQHVIETIKGDNLSGINIKEIKRNSPISVSLDGAGEAIQLIKDTVVPWRRKHAETMARLLEQEKSVEIEAKKAEVVDKKIVAREQANKLKLENEKLRLELQQAKIQLAIEMLNSMSSNLTQAEREIIINKLLPILDTLCLSRLEMVITK